MKVLVVDDSATARMVLREAVEDLGHECVVAEDGSEGWRAFRQEEPEAVISDWLMPGMDGIDLCRLIREDADAAYTYFVMITSLDDGESALSGMRAGADDYLTKPPAGPVRPWRERAPGRARHGLGSELSVTAST